MLWNWLVSFWHLLGPCFCYSNGLLIDNQGEQDYDQTGIHIMAKNIIIDLTGENDIVLPKNLEQDCLVLGKFPDWTLGSYQLCLDRTKWLIEEIQKREYLNPDTLVVFIPESALGFGMALGIGQGVMKLPHIIVVQRGVQVDLLEFLDLNPKEKEVVPQEKPGE